ncbi:SRPBCC family protein [Streptomyces sp. NPDC048650]|uniref:SRPBCC family protein n=1 Tax=Streptomyces sp. NPDC048650 TaxID=3365583 RepID=UPI00371CA1D0
MTETSLTHATFSLEREYAASPPRVFAAWADPEVKARWFAGPAAEYELDFRVGGHEIVRGRDPQGSALTFTATYHDIVPNERIVHTSHLYDGEVLSTVSLTTVEFLPAGEGTCVRLTEQGAYVVGHEQPAWREQGTLDQLTALEAELRPGADRDEAVSDN